MPVDHVLQSKQVATNRSFCWETYLNFFLEVLRLKVLRQASIQYAGIQSGKRHTNCNRPIIRNTYP